MITLFDDYDYDLLVGVILIVAGIVLILKNEFEE